MTSSSSSSTTTTTSFSSATNFSKTFIPEKSVFDGTDLNTSWVYFSPKPAGTFPEAVKSYLFDESAGPKELETKRVVEIRVSPSGSQCVYAAPYFSYSWVDGLLPFVPNPSDKVKELMSKREKEGKPIGFTTIALSEHDKLVTDVQGMESKLHAFVCKLYPGFRVIRSYPALSVSDGHVSEVPLNPLTKRVYSDKLAWFNLSYRLADGEEERLNAGDRITDAIFSPSLVILDIDEKEQTISYKWRWNLIKVVRKPHMERQVYTPIPLDKVLSQVAHVVQASAPVESDEENITASTPPPASSFSGMKRQPPSQKSIYAEAKRAKTSSDSV